MKLVTAMTTLTLFAALSSGCGKNNPEPATQQQAADKTAAAQQPEASNGAIINKKLADLTKDDLIEAAKALGWGDKPTATSGKSGSNEIITVYVQEENPAGYQAPNGKFYATKKIRLSVLGDAQTAASSAKRDREEGAMVKEEGNRYIAVSYEIKDGIDKAKSKEIFDKLFGGQ